jgi:hypothetical protein
MKETIEEVVIHRFVCELCNTRYKSAEKALACENSCKMAKGIAIKKFILWDANDGNPPRDEEGGFLTPGLIGVIDEGNVYLRSYAHYLPSGNKGIVFPAALEVGQFTYSEFNLSGSKGIYQVWRVQ